MSHDADMTILVSAAREHARSLRIWAEEAARARPKRPLEAERLRASARDIDAAAARMETRQPV